jgi:glycerate 2-kinase
MKPRYNHHRQHIDSLIKAALVAAEPAKAVTENLTLEQGWLHVGGFRYQPSSGRIYLIAVGKAAIPMGEAAWSLLKDHLSAAVIISKRATGSGDDNRHQSGTAPGLQLFFGSHPVSDEAGVQATAAAIDLLKQTRAGDLVLCLISGGTSALLTQPKISLADWQKLVTSLLASGCTINELNAVRKRLDRVKGGGLARLAAPARCVSLILSDVVGNALDVIGSGPTVPNPDDPGLAREILDRYDLKAAVPTGLWQRVMAALEHSSDEQVAPDQMPAAEHLIVSDVRHAVSAAVEAAAHLGFDSRLLTCHLEGEAREVGRVAAALAIDATPGSCLVLGGETTVTLRGDGKGGRNQELALAASIGLANRPGCVVASFATDGEDGPTNAAGAWVTGQTVAQAEARNIDPHRYLANNNSYEFFQQVGGLLETGPTGTNVNDLVLILKYRPTDER